MTPSTDLEILRRLRELGPFSDDETALAALHAVLQGIGGGLTRDERTAVAASLPPECARMLLDARDTGCQSSSDLFLEVAIRRKVPLARAVELAEITCRALGEVLSSTAHARLRHALPDIARLFTPPVEEFAPPSPPAFSENVPHDLAEGRPGGSRPLASANPAELAHSNSIARSDDPHGDTKLSSTRGLTQEREGRTLATGRPGSRRPLSKDH